MSLPGAEVAAVFRVVTGHPQLPGFLNSLAGPLNHYGYLAIAVLVMVESFGPPLPGETAIIAGSIYASAGSLNIVAVAGIAFAASVIGDNLAYLIGRKGGRAVITRYGRYIGAGEERYAKAEAFFRRHGVEIVIVARFIEGLRQLNGLVAGTTRMPYPRFLAAQALGAALWVGVWSGLGYAAGSHIDAIYSGVTRFGYVALGVAAVVVVAVAVRRRRARNQT